MTKKHSITTKYKDQKYSTLENVFKYKKHIKRVNCEIHFKFLYQSRESKSKQDMLCVLKISYTYKSIYKYTDTYNLSPEK